MRRMCWHASFLWLHICVRIRAYEPTCMLRMLSRTWSHLFPRVLETSFLSVVFGEPAS